MEPIFLNFPVITVDTLKDEIDGNMLAGDVSLREAIAAASPGSTITFDSNLASNTADGQRTIRLSLGELVIDKPLNIVGLGAETLTINGRNRSSIFRIDDGNNDTAIDVTIEGLKLTRGKALEGGAIVVEGENLAVKNSNITGNSSGVIINQNADDNCSVNDLSLFIANTTIANNQEADLVGVQNASNITLIDNEILNGENGSLTLIAGNTTNSENGNITLPISGTGNITINAETPLSLNSAGNITISAETLPTINPNFNLIQESFSQTGNSGNGGNLSITAGGVVSVTTGGNVIITVGDGSSDGSNIINGTRFRDRLVGTSSTDLINGSAGNDTLSGKDGNDFLDGRTGTDRLLGGDGNDRLSGGVGNDKLLGGAGDDRLLGEGGRDLLRGGTGRDTFAYNKLNEGKDVVLDFEVGIDTFDLSFILSDARYSSATPFEDYIRIGQTGRANATISVFDIERSSVGGALSPCHNRAIFRDIALVRNVTAAELNETSFVL